MDSPRIRALRPIALLVCSLALVAGCSGSDSGSSSASSASSASSKKDGSTTQAAEAAVPMSSDDLQSDYLKVIKEVLPSVVQIQASSDLGSGIVYDDQAHRHQRACRRGREDVQGDHREQRGRAHRQARLLVPRAGLAVVKLDKVPDGLKAATFADSSKVEVGQIVLAMGSPLGLSSSVTQGIVSATGRTVSEGSSGGGTGATIANMVQTSAAINPGNSGGALVNLNGQVIGIPTLAATDPDLGGGAAPGIGFAIPSSMVKTVADQIVKDGKVTDSGRAALGITGRTVVDDRYQAAGVAVVEVKSGGAADKAGIRAGDIITKLGDTGITTITSLSEALASDRPGQRTTVTYSRNGASKKVDVTLGEQ